MDRRRAGLAAGMVAVLVFGGSGALAASPPPGGADDPCAKTAACSPADIEKLKIAKLKEEAAAKAGPANGPGDDGSTCSADVKQTEAIDSGKLARALAAALGVGLDRATAAVEELDLLARKGGVTPDSPEFAAVAARLGVSADQLNQALYAFKRSYAPPETGTPDPVKRPGPEKTPGS